MTSFHITTKFETETLAYIAAWLGVSVIQLQQKIIEVRNLLRMICEVSRWHFVILKSRLKKTINLSLLLQCLRVPQDMHVLWMIKTDWIASCVVYVELTVMTLVYSSLIPIKHTFLPYCCVTPFHGIIARTTNALHYDSM